MFFLIDFLVVIETAVRASQHVHHSQCSTAFRSSPGPRRPTYLSIRSHDIDGTKPDTP